MSEQRGEGRLGIKTRIPRIDWSKTDFKMEKVPYDPAPYIALETIDQVVPVGEADVIYDLGCGMGRVVCHYAAKPVAKVVGVEFDSGLARKAEENTQRMLGRRAAAQITEGDAAAVNLSDATVVFMFNPFGPETMEKVVSNFIAQSASGARIVYVNHVHEEMLGRRPELRETARFKVRYDLGHAPVVVWTKV